jgi:hypothetical protein
MPRHWLAFFAAAALTGCMKPAASTGPAPLLIPVAAVSGPPIAIGGPVDTPHPAYESDGHAVGDRVAVESHGSWLQATLIERRGDRWLVRYDAAWGGARDSMEELVETARIRASAPHMDEEHSPDDVDP